MSPLPGERHHLAVCDSTNDEAARLGRAGAPHGTVVTADVQHRGRGRQGHTFYSPAGENLYLSVLLRPGLSPQQAPLLTLCAGVALADTVAQGFGDRVHCELKWPNDLLLAPKADADAHRPPRKAAGILTEMVCTFAHLDFVVLGIGVNLNTTVFPQELSDIATSLRLCCGDAVDRETFLQQLLPHLHEVHDLYVAQGPPSVLPRYQAHAAFLRRGKALMVRSGTQVLRGVPLGLCTELATAGALLLSDATGTVHRVISGEVAILINESR